MFKTMKRAILLFIILFKSGFSNGQCWQNVSAGGSHTIAIRTGGSLWSWGRNNLGQLGTAGIPSTSSNSPIQIGNASDWLVISAGSSHSVAIKTNGTLWTWGWNSFGQLGDNSTNNSTIPIQIGTDNDWAFISAGDKYTLALKTNGTLWGWGDNEYGQLGDGTSGAGNKILIPTPIGVATWSFVSAGSDHSLAIKTDGTLWAWGRNNNGKLGNGSTTDSYMPTQISALTNWQTVLAAQSHSVARKTDGSVWTWGDNTNGQLGDGTSGVSAYKTLPINVGSMSISTTIAKGFQHTIVRKNDGKLYSWGGNASGQLGDGTNTQQNNPVTVNNDTDWLLVDSKATHTTALKTDGTLWTWGSNLYGQLGNASFSAQNTPQLITCPTLASEMFSISDRIKIYPNPVTNFVNVEFLDNIKIQKIIIVDLSGKTLIEKSEMTNEFNLENLTTGIYFLQIYSSEGNYQTKLIKN